MIPNYNIQATEIKEEENASALVEGNSSTESLLCRINETASEEQNILQRLITILENFGWSTTTALQLTNDILSPTYRFLMGNIHSDIENNYLTVYKAAGFASIYIDIGGTHGEDSWSFAYTFFVDMPNNTITFQNREFK